MQLIVSPEDVAGNASRPQELKDAVRSFERNFIKCAIEQANGDRESAARALGISIATMYRKLGPS